MSLQHVKSSAYSHNKNLDSWRSVSQQLK